MLQCDKLAQFSPIFVLKLEVRALLQNICNGICGLVALKIFSGEGAPRHLYDFRGFRTNYFKLATPVSKMLVHVKIFKFQDMLNESERDCDATNGLYTQYIAS